MKEIEKGTNEVHKGYKTDQLNERREKNKKILERKRFYKDIIQHTPIG